MEFHANLDQLFFRRTRKIYSKAGSAWIGLNVWNVVFSKLYTPLGNITQNILTVRLRRRTQKKDDNMQSKWAVIEKKRHLLPDRTACIITDMWESKGCRAHIERINVIVPYLNDVIIALRSKGVQIIHAPSGTMQYYEGTPAREWMKQLPKYTLPPPKQHIEPPLPIHSTENTCDSEGYFGQVERQHPGLIIDLGRDGLSDSGQEIWSYIQHYNIEYVLYAGVHTNMCIFNRPFAIKQMTKWGKEVAIIRELTDASYNPYEWPYVEHEEGTQLMIEYFEKFWCPSISMKDLVGYRLKTPSPWKQDMGSYQSNVPLSKCKEPHAESSGEKFHLQLQIQRKDLDEKQLNIWRHQHVQSVILAQETAILILNMWDRVKDPKENMRLRQLARRMDQWLSLCRCKGVSILFSPTGVIQQYDGTPVRRRVLKVPNVPLPPDIYYPVPYGTRFLDWYPSAYGPPPVNSRNEDLPLPLRFGEYSNIQAIDYSVAIRQHETIVINEQHDAIVSGKEELWNVLSEKGIHNVLMAGSYLNQGILDGPIGIKQLVRWGLNVVLVRDLVDIYNSILDPPYI